MLRVEAIEVARAGIAILKSMTLAVQPGQVIGVLGANGAGKSTLLGALCGDLTISSGQVWLDGRPLRAWPAAERAQRLAVLPQVSGLSFAFPVQEVVAMGRLPHASGAQRDAQIVRQALMASDTLNLAERNYLELSGGERQRVHLARVLAQLWPGDPGTTLLLDEPTSALDPLHQHTVLQAVRNFAQRGAAVLVILHDLNLAARYCDHIVLLEKGGAYVQGAPKAVLTPDALRRVFGIEVLVQAHPEGGYPLVIAR